MTPEQINLIEHNFNRIATRAEDVATVFYNRLFALQPALQLLFPADLTEQKKKLIAALGVAIKSLHEPEKLVPVLENLGRKHALYGVREAHYNTVGAALLRTLRDALGEEFTTEAHGAWAEMYSFVAATMKRAARELSAESKQSEIKQPKINESEINLQETRKMPKILILASQTALAFLLTMFLVFAAQAQTTEFPYYGTFPNSVTPATGTFDLEVKLFDAPDGGNQVGSTLTFSGVAVKTRSFGVVLDFGAAPFSGADRYIEVGARRSGSGDPFVVPSARQKILSIPYAIRSLNAGTADTALNVVSQSGEVINVENLVNTNDPRLTDARDPLPGSANYIQNTTATQPLSNFNISGEGKAKVLTAAQQFNIGANRVLSNAGDSNLFVGAGAGAANASGGNSFVGAQSGLKNTTGFSNSFFGAGSGANNTTGSENTFSGLTAGFNNTTGGSNAFYGKDSGFSNTTGSNNSFFGRAAGGGNTTGANNSFFGRNAGEKNTTGSGNAFFGILAGRQNTSGNYNSFYGNEAGLNNTADANAFFGSAAGRENTTGKSNSFFGTDAGRSNKTAENNAFFGTAAGRENTTGFSNSFFGSLAGLNNTTGDGNAFFGASAGVTNSTGKSNAFFGGAAGFTNQTGNYNSFVGFEAGGMNTTGSVNSFFGSAAGRANTIGTNNAFYGADAGRLNTTGADNSFVGTFAGFNNQTGALNTFVGISAGGANTTGGNNTMLGANSNVAANNLNFATAIGANATVSTSNTIALGRADGSDKVRVFGLGAAGLTQLCRNANNEISSCSSSLRYKTNIAPFDFGLNLVKQLKPITFDWKNGGMHDLGLGAEEVAAVEPLLAIYDQNGRVEGVKYDRIGVVLLNAVKQQQAQIEAQAKQIEQLKAIVCAQNPQAAICEGEK